MGVFEERFRDLPIYKEMDRILGGFENCDFPREEFIVRILMAAENGLNWDTLCKNCGVLMDDNYAKHCEIEQLKEDKEFLLSRVDELRGDIASLERELAMHTEL